MKNEYGGYGRLLVKIFGYSINDILPLRSEDAEKVDRALVILMPREKHILNLRFGLKAQKMTLKEVGDTLRISPERVRQIEAKALQKLRRLSARKEIFESSAFFRLALEDELLEVKSQLEKKQEENALLISRLHAYQTAIKGIKDELDKAIISDETSREGILSAYPFLATSMDEFELSVRVNNCLKHAGIKRIIELVEKSEVEILDTKDFGQKSLAELKDFLASHGLRFGMKLPQDFVGLKIVD